MTLKYDSSNPPHSMMAYLSIIEILFLLSYCVFLYRILWNSSLGKCHFIQISQSFVRKIDFYFHPFCLLCIFYFQRNTSSILLWRLHVFHCISFCILTVHDFVSVFVRFPPLGESSIIVWFFFQLYKPKFLQLVMFNYALMSESNQFQYFKLYCLFYLKMTNTRRVHILPLLPIGNIPLI